MAATGVEGAGTGDALVGGDGGKESPPETSAGLGGGVLARGDDEETVIEVAGTMARGEVEVAVEELTARATRASNKSFTGMRSSRSIACTATRPSSRVLQTRRNKSAGGTKQTMQINVIS